MATHGPKRSLGRGRAPTPAGRSHGRDVGLSLLPEGSQRALSIPAVYAKDASQLHLLLFPALSDFGSGCVFKGFVSVYVEI